jgi:hypothetical protein
MIRVFRTIIKEAREAIPPTLFFLVAFHLAALIRALNEEAYGITPGASTLATIGALIVGKTSLIVDHLRITNLFSCGPLIVSIVWKALFFSLLATLFQGVEELVPLVSKYGSVGLGAEHLFSEIVWPRFWANHILLLVFVLIYSLAVELIRVFGATEMKHLFFGTGHSRLRSH